MVLAGLLSVVLTGSESKALDMSAYAKEVADRTKTAALICSPELLKVNADIAQTDADSFLEPARRQGFTFLRSDVAVGSRSGIPRSKYGVLSQWVPNKNGGGGFQVASLPAEAMKDGKFSFKSKPGEFLSVQTVSSAKFAKSLNVSAYYLTGQNEFPIAFYGENVGEIDFLRAVAKGLGGTFRIAAKEYVIGFDANNFRREALKLTNQATEQLKNMSKPSGAGLMSGPVSASAAPDTSMQQSAVALLTATLNQLTPELMEQTFAYPNTTTRLNLNVFKNLQPAIATYLRAAEAAGGNSGNHNSSAQVRRQPNDRAAAMARGLLNRINARNPGHLTIQTDFRISLELNTNDRNPVILQVL